MQNKLLGKSIKISICLDSIFSIVVICIFLSACAVYGPNSEQKSELDLLSEKNYQQTGSVLGVPVLKSKKRNTVVEGTVYISEFIPLKFEKLRLLNSRGDTVSETTTSNNGDFEFKDYIINGNYTIKIDSKKYSGGKKIKVTDYQIKNITIEAKPNINLYSDPAKVRRGR